MLQVNKNLVSAFVIMVLIFVVLFCYYVGVEAKSVPYSLRSCNQDRDLKLVHVVLRHGDRTPADTYLADPYINETFYPYGWGQLTNKGKRSVYRTGEWLRQRYANFLGKEYTRDMLFAQSTGVTRTRESMQLLLAGLFPPKNSILEWNKGLNWQPIAFESQPLNQDSLLLVRIPCPRYHEELERVLSEPEVKDVLISNAELFEKLSQLSGQAIKTPEDVASLYTTLKAEKEYGLKLPKWTEKYFPTEMQNLTDFSFVLNVYNDELKKLKGGPFVKKMLKEWIDFSKNQLSPPGRKLFTYIGHDSTVVNILSALKVWETQFPDYTIMTIFELSKDIKTGVYGVEVFLKKSSFLTDLIPLTIPGCEKFCPLDTLTKLLEPILPKDLEKECEAINKDFTTPPPRGP